MGELIELNLEEISYEFFNSMMKPLPVPIYSGLFSVCLITPSLISFALYFI